MRFKSVAALAVAATIGYTAHAGAAQAAYSIGPVGANYVGTDLKDNSFTISGLSMNCTSSTFTGVADGSASTSFTPAYSGCSTNIAGTPIPATVTVTGPWNLTVSQGPTSGVYGGSVTIPPTSSVRIRFPVLGACRIDISGGQTFTNGTSSNVLTGRNSGADALLTADVRTVSYTSASCPGVATSGTGRYRTSPINGDPTDGISIPGINVSGP